MTSDFHLCFSGPRTVKGKNMMRKIRTLAMRILSQVVPPKKVRREETEAKNSVRRRVEITVERESISILVPGQPQGSQPTVSRGLDRERKSKKF